MKTQTLTKILQEFPFEYSPTSADPVITGVTGDTRNIQPGNLFVAIQGKTFDGHAYIEEAIHRGAAAVVGSQPIPATLPVPYVQVVNPRRSLAYLAAAFYDHPARKMTMIGITGTDGKTTTTNLLYQILLSAGLRVGMISTVNAVIGNQVLDTGFHVTTPDAPDVQRYLSLMQQAGLTHVVLETTSHGWEQFRVDASEFDVAIITNITHEHLNDHGSLENYRKAKMRLFESLSSTLSKVTGNPRLAVLNQDDSSIEYLRPISGKNVLEYGVTPTADVRAQNIRTDAAGIHFDITSADYKVSATCKLIGEYNVHNCLAAFSAAVHGLGLDPAIAARGIADMPGIPGRMERIEMGQAFTAIVDFAHTPFALKSALQAARQMTSQHVIVVFGSAGLRDKEKRRMMSELSAQLADVTILTAEDPRTESLDNILEEMAAGARAYGGVENQTFYRVPDRGEAIRFALQIAKAGDIVLACGKGHEQSMCFGSKEFLWDDRTAMQAALAEHLGVDGPEMGYLPTQDKAEAEWLSY